MTKNDYIEKITQNLEHLTKDELKDVSILTTAQLGVRSKFAERQQLEHEIANLTPQLQQQALPVVPEFVAEWYESHSESSESLEFYIYLFCGKFYSSRDSRKNRELTNFEKWFGEDKNKPIETLIRMQDGYTVEKPQLFKLIFPNSTAVLQKDGELNSFADTVYKKYLIENAMTEQEIKSIDKRYWEFAVPMEDGE